MDRQGIGTGYLRLLSAGWSSGWVQSKVYPRRAGEQMEPGSDGHWGGFKREVSSLETEQGCLLISAEVWGSPALSFWSFGKTAADRI